MPSHVARPFSTTTQVYPSHLTTLHKAGRVEKKLATATIAAVGIGYGIAKYKQNRIQQQQLQHYSQISQPKMTERETETIMNAYGDRSTLAELEAAVLAYQAQRQT